MGAEAGLKKRDRPPSRPRRGYTAQVKPAFVTQGREIFLRMALALGGVLAILAGLEASLRGYHRVHEYLESSRRPPIDRRIFVPSDDPELIFELRPGAESGVFRVNRWGLLGPDVEKTRPMGTFRVAVVGDSISCGFGLFAPARGWVALLGEALRSRLAASPRYEVLNFGVNGYGIRQELQMARRALAFQPDLLILQSTLNDPYPSAVPPYTPNHSRSRSQAWDFLYRRLLTQRHWTMEMVTRNFDEEGLRAIGDGMRGFGEIRRGGTPVLVVLFPYLYAPAYPLWQIGQFHAVFAQAARENQLDFLDLREVFEREGIASDRWPQDPVHPSEQGHVLAAEVIERTLESRGLLPTRASDP